MSLEGRCQWNRQFPQSPTPASSAWKPSRLFQGIHYVVGVHRGPPGHVVGVDRLLEPKKVKTYLLAPAGLHLDLDEARLALSRSLLALLGLVGVEGHRWPW